MKPTEDNFKEWNETLSLKQYPDDFYKNLNFISKWIESCRFKHIINSLEIKESDIFLEIGGGQGELVKRLLTYKRCKKIFIVEISSRLIEYLNSEISKLSKNIKIIQADGGRLPFKEQSIDKIVCSEVLEHVLKPDEIVREASRVLRRGGVAVFTVPNDKFKQKIKSMVMKFFKPKGIGATVKDEWHIHEFDEQSFRNLLEQNFDVLYLEKIPSRVFPIIYLAKCQKR